MSATAELRSSGLEGVVAGKTEICSVEQGKLIYRGYEIHDLAANATFEEVAFVLLEGHKPSAAELARFKAEVVAERALPASIVQFLKDAGPALKKGTAVPMDVLRSAVSLLGHLDSDCQSVAADANLAAEGVKDTGFLRQVDFGPFIEWDRRDDPFAPRSGTSETFATSWNGSWR